MPRKRKPKRIWLLGTGPSHEYARSCGHWYLEANGLLRFHSGAYRGRYVHVVVWEWIAGRKVAPGMHVHEVQHGCLCGHNLIEMPAQLNSTATLKQYRSTIDDNEVPW